MFFYTSFKCYSFESYTKIKSNRIIHIYLSFKYDRYYPDYVGDTEQFNFRLKNSNINSETCTHIRLTIYLHFFVKVNITFSAYRRDIVIVG